MEPRLDTDLDNDLVVMEIEEAIAALDGIEAVRLVAGERRPIDELHAIIAPERDPKQTSRDLQTLLLARYGIDVDRRVISIVQLPADTGQRLHDGLPRLLLDAVHIAVRGRETSVTVELLHGDNQLLGCVGPIGEITVNDATAEATLDAVTEALPDQQLRMAGAEVTEIGSERVAVVAVNAADGRSRDLLTGSAVVRQHESDAIARAVLDATNRLQRD